MKLNNRGSFTAEASIVAVIVFLVVFMLVKTYILQFSAQYGRKVEEVTKETEEVNYLQVIHGYLILDDIGEAVSGLVENY